MSDINVGNHVKKVGGSDTVYEVLYIHRKDPDRVWYVVTYGGDIPMSYRKNQLIKVNPTRSFYLGMIKYEVEVVNGTPDFSTTKEV